MRDGGIDVDGLAKHMMNVALEAMVTRTDADRTRRRAQKLVDFWQE
jgi:hypothetical protein